MIARLLLVVFLFGVGALPAFAGPGMSREARLILSEASELMKEGRCEEAIDRIQKHISPANGQASSEAYLLLGGARHDCGKTREALQSFRAGMKAYPDNALLIRNTGVVLYELEQYAEAGKLLEAAYGLDPEPDAALLYQAASAYYAGGEYAQAARAVDALLSGGGARKTAWVELGVHAHLRSGNGTRAQALLDQCLAADPENPKYWELSAKLHLDREEYAGAAAALEIRSRLTSPSEHDLAFLSELYRYAGASGKAAETLLRDGSAVSLPEQAMGVARLLAVSGRTPEAVKLLDRFSNHSGGLLYKGELLFGSRRFEEAEDAIRKSIDAGALEPDIRFYLGLCAWERSDWDAAEREFSSVARTPEFKGRVAWFSRVLHDLKQARIDSADPGRR